MHAWSVYPSNYQSLSSNVIGKVVQRVYFSRDRWIVGDKQEIEAAFAHSDQLWPKTPSVEMDLPAEISIPNKDETSPTKSDLSFTHKRSRSVECNNDAIAVVPDDERMISIRERRRLKQIRYRAKKRRLLMELEDDIQKLGDEIQELETRRQDFSLKRTVWDVTAKYFNIFRHGSVPEALHTCALRFLQKTMAPDVSDGLVSGVEELLKNWALLSLYFDNFDVQLQRQDTIGTDSLIATTTTNITISYRTLRQVFPHLNSDKEGGIHGGKWSALAAKLLNQRIVVHSSVRFDWDNENGQVVSIQSQSDLLTPLLHLLGNLEDVSRVFDKAHITPDFKLKIT